MARKAIPVADVEALRWVGMLGHTFVVLTDDGKGGRRCPMETCDRASALAEAAKRVNESPAVYQQIKAAKWKAVRR